ncbi:MAG: VanZ family protein [Lachnospiraceae bacterium]|nr:VanZ family protein [Lachnospiraceae bacterium]
MKKILLSITLIFWVGFILFLSFQTGTDTAATSLGLTKWILQFFIEGEIPDETLMHWHMLFRLWAHPAIFFFYGMLAMGVTTEFISKYSVCLLVTGISGIGLAVFSEVGKWNIPGRHCDIKEMALNVVGVLVGIILMLAAQLVSKRTERKKR